MNTLSLPHLPKWLTITLIACLFLCAIIYCAVGWYFSGKLFALQPQKIEHDHLVKDIEKDNYTIAGPGYDINGLVGIVNKSNAIVGILGPPTNLHDDDKTSTRRFSSTPTAQLQIGEQVSLQGNIWVTDPKDALDIDFKNVQYESPAGNMDAWVIPGQNPTTWTIAVHGIGANKNEMLRFVKPVLAAGNTMMIINYRGDVDNPASPDDRNHFGDTEWQDVEAAVRYAKSQGATTINLYGSSLGGSLTQNYLRRSADVKNTDIAKVVLDSPALDWNEILAFRIQKMGYPTIVANPGKTFARVRAGIDFNRATTKPGSITHKTLIIHNKDDNSVPQAASVRVAQAQPNLVTFADFKSGGHIRAWNHDPAKYETLVTNFLKN
jgi:uncharacterized protein